MFGKILRILSGFMFLMASVSFEDGNMAGGMQLLCWAAALYAISR